jgi:hypothetical protein
MISACCVQRNFLASSRHPPPSHLIVLRAKNHAEIPGMSGRSRFYDKANEASNLSFFPLYLSTPDREIL